MLKDPHFIFKWSVFLIRGSHLSTVLVNRSGRGKKDCRRMKKISVNYCLMTPKGLQCDPAAEGEGPLGL